MHYLLPGVSSRMYIVACTARLHSYGNAGNMFPVISKLWQPHLAGWAKGKTSGREKIEWLRFFFFFL